MPFSNTSTPDPASMFHIGPPIQSLNDRSSGNSMTSGLGSTAGLPKLSSSLSVPPGAPVRVPPPLVQARERSTSSQRQLRGKLVGQASKRS
jgi:hypothetical protein